MKNLVVASSSTLYGQSYLEYLLPTLQELFGSRKKILFIPFARPGGISHDDYTAIAQKALGKINAVVRGIHTFSNPKKAIQQSQGFFTGGGNTFLLVKQLHDLNLMDVLATKIKTGTPYLGTSAGSNICGLNMKTTNDMPIVYPKSFNTLGILPFNINPHYLDPDKQSSHMGETREQRIKEFHYQNNTPVIGLRESSWLRVKGGDILLEGPLNARVFEAEKSPYEILPGTSLSHLN